MPALPRGVTACSAWLLQIICVLKDCHIATVTCSNAEATCGAIQASGNADRGTTCRCSSFQQLLSPQGTVARGSLHVAMAAARLLWPAGLRSDGRAEHVRFRGPATRGVSPAAQFGSAMLTCGMCMANTALHRHMITASYAGCSKVDQPQYGYTGGHATQPQGQQVLFPVRPASPPVSPAHQPQLVSFP